MLTPLRATAAMAAVVGVVGVVGVGVLVMAPRSSPSCHLRCGGEPSVPPPTSPTPCATPSLVPIGGAVPANTYDAFGTLPAGEQQALMQQALARYDAVVANAFSSRDPAQLPEIATGTQLSVLQEDVKGAAREHQCAGPAQHATALHVALSSQPYRFVAVDEQYLDIGSATPMPTTPNVGTLSSGLDMVIEEGHLEGEPLLPAAAHALSAPPYPAGPPSRREGLLNHRPWPRDRVPAGLESELQSFDTAPCAALLIAKGAHPGRSWSTSGTRRFP
jgi:hypothetical protein